MEEIKEFIKNNLALLGLGTVGLSSIIFASWSYIKGIWFNTWRKLFLNIDISHSGEAYTAILLNLFVNYRKFEFGESEITTSNFLHRGKRFLGLGEKRKKTIIFYKKGRIIIFLTKKSNEDYKEKLITIRIAFNLKKFVLDSWDLYKQYVENNKTYNYTTFAGSSKSYNGKDNPAQNGLEVSPQSSNSEHSSMLVWSILNTPFNITTEEIINPEEDIFRGMFLNEETYDIINKIDNWLDLRDWYFNRNIPWKMSFLLHGVGGTGKTTFIARLARKYRMTLNKFDLSTYGNREFVKDWEEVISKASITPCIILFEDFDNTFVGRENITTKSKSSLSDALTFDCLLNCMSGVTVNNGVLLFITTNNIESIDQAIGVHDKNKNISTRPGRIDYIYEFKSMEESPRKEMIHYMLKDLGLDLEDILKITKGMTASQVQQYCIEIGSDILRNRKIT